MSRRVLRADARPGRFARRRSTTSPSLRTRSLAPSTTTRGSHLLPDASDRTDRLRLFFETELAGSGSRAGSPGPPTSVVGGAIWAPPDGWRVPVTTTAPRAAPDAQGVRQAPAAWPCARGCGWRAGIRDGRRTGYLAVMGVAPEWQGRGLGTALMSPALEALDAEGTPAYLEASTPRAASSTGATASRSLASSTSPRAARRSGRCGGSPG